MDTQSYKISKDYLKSLVKRNIMNMIGITLGVPGMSLFFTYNQVDNLQSVARFAFMVSLFVDLEIVIVTYFLIRKQKKYELQINDTYFCRLGGYYNETIDYEYIRKIHIKRHPNGEIAFIKIFSRWHPTTLMGYENMTHIAEIIKENLPINCELKENSYRLNYNNPLIYFGVMIITYILFILLKLLDILYYRIAYTIGCIILGIFCIFFRPISNKLGNSYRPLEVIAGMVLIILTIINFIDFIRYSQFYTF